MLENGKKFIDATRKLLNVYN